MHWLYLAIATVFEVAFALGTNATKGFTRLVPSIVTLVAAAGGIYFLSLALRTLDVGVGYTIWTGIGSVGTVVLGVLLFKERLTGARVLCFGAIVLGVIGLRVAAGV
ncbi:multidrug efflux SMR transporter [Actinosynnema sp. NPDC047251]|uniref:Putative membrane protein n=1 Tax=Saccharothrix espanaensis (strain ATCC 51144 / DSM 44229 / JCM 9112 / NBRC 15066 / NRRL 15764) TaxID=1179773 RepID=K0KC06_SACES|nr:multidrug efflux SMR transporter [Saccharothrix espanaensis]CCH34359.1 putative membrane protein [Saccharothrix espanaensis DSM 44229]